MDGSAKQDSNPATKLLYAFGHRNFHVNIGHSSNAVGIGFTHFTLDPKGHISPEQALQAVKILDHLPVDMPFEGLPKNTKGWSHLDKQEYLDFAKSGLCKTPLRAQINGKGEVELTLEGKYDSFPKERVNRAYETYAASHAGKLRVKQVAPDAAITR